MMQTILVAYGTTEGHTREVAEFVAERLRIRGHRVDVVDTASAAAAHVQPIYQAAFIGGSVHYRRHQTALAHFVRVNLSWLESIPTAFFSVNLAMKHIDAGDQIEAERNARGFLEETGLQPKRLRLVAGALKYSQYDFFKRFMQRAIARHWGGATDSTADHEYTDWNDVEAFVDEFLTAAGLGGARRVA
jgi:menaquinone-dependent protoporphyrinogen oxidase